MRPETFRAIATRPFESDIVLHDDGSRYNGTHIPLIGTTIVTVTRDGITAELLNDDDWELRELAARERGPIPQGGLFRVVAPGRVLGPHDQGTITPENQAWEGFHATYVGQRDEAADRSKIYNFTIARLIVHGPGDAERIAAVRHIYARGAWDGSADYQGQFMVVRSLSGDQPNLDEQTIAATFDWSPDIIQAECAWHALNFFTGNTLKHLAEEVYDDDGVLIRRIHEFGNDVHDARRQFFHRFHGEPAPNAMGIIGDGFVRLMRAGFPIEVVLEHLHESPGRSIDVEAQHLVLAIHAAIEAWNRMFGSKRWIGTKRWQRIASQFRQTLEEHQEFESLPPELQENVRTALRCANDTTTSWRQAELFRALGIPVADEDTDRALKLRHELLHNGYFRERWHELSQDQKQQRHEDVERLRRLVLLIVFKLTGYEGDFMNPMTFSREHVDLIDLPEAIRP